MTFLEKISYAQHRTNSMLCVGLDTDLNTLPESVRTEQDPVFSFNKAIIDATKDFACCYKLNIAYYEARAEEGIASMRKTLEAVPSHLLTILDIKRGDIGNTCDQYAYAYQEQFPVDAITVSPLMGHDSVEPFLRHEDKGVFFLGLTSNPGAQDFEYLELKNGKRLYEQITDSVREWNKPKLNCGLVVGATKPDELRALRERAPELPFLIPGIGAQGGSLEAVLDANGEGKALINVSRAIAGASRGSDFAEAAGKAAEALVNQMRGLPQH